MASEQPGIPTPLNGAYAELETKTGALVSEVLSVRDPELHARLSSSPEVTERDADEVQWLLYLEFAQQLGEDWEPTAYGKQVDNAIGAFVQHFVIDRDA